MSAAKLLHKPRCPMPVTAAHPAAMKHSSHFLALPALAILTAAPSALAEDADIAELKAMVRSMQQTIADQNERIATLEGRHQEKPEETKKATAPRSKKRGNTPPASPATAASITPQAAPSALPQESAGVRDADTFAGLQQAAPRANNAPLDPEMKGFIPIPGTDTVFKIGGSTRIDAITDFGDNGNPNQFVPSSMPVGGQAGADGGERSTIHGKATRISLELRRPVGDDNSLRIYNENDFYDDSTSSSMKFRVRHFYGQAWNFLLGQTFSAFMDVDAFPDVVDYQGPNGIVNRRQPQIRYTQPVYDDFGKVQLFASIEQPESQINTGTDEFQPGSSSLNRLPDGILGARWEGGRGHLQAASLFRELSYETEGGSDESTFGWGISLSGSLDVCEKDKLSAQVTYGEGIGRYVNDLSGQNVDAALDHGNFDAIPVFAAMAGYTHHWSEQWRSTIAGGWVHADSPDSLGPYAVDNTIYGSVNLMWHPTPSFRMGLEYLHGRKETLDDSTGDAQRLNFVIRYDLVR